MKSNYSQLALQFTLFALVGALNTLVDLGVLNILILCFGIGPGGYFYPYFKIVSFSAAVFNSYFWNKNLVFASSRRTDRSNFVAFLVVSLIGLGLNVIISWSTFMLMGRSAFTLGSYGAATLAALVGTFAVLVWNFFGYKFIVFEK